ncbi:MAG: glycosyltransferase [Bacteroidetes bacterium]|jgi:dolichyl-phosphate beta-glucosyltransferase|nr:glycosyltransferase [Bacteroidota bacterium]MBT6684944.1 glycosyltransferase [Bacteroidota bacterium]MBT7145249.1 glycosyltransferase [Bacteroidota bacterium]MBT7493020.1 glycosyltransferase [Bacteroidota bacterium]
MLSIILPSYNCSKNLLAELPGFIKYLATIKTDYEIIIVDDGSADADISKSIAEKHNCIFLKNEKNLGKGAAVRKGILNSKGEFLIFTDADIPFQFDSFQKFLYYLDFKEFDMVVGDRTLPESSYFTEISKTRKIGSDIFSFIVGRFITGGWFDTQCGMKGFRRNVAFDIFSVNKINGFAFDVELLYIALKRNFDIKRLPVNLRCNESSSVKVLKHGFLMVIDVFRIIYYFYSGKYKK